MLTSLGINVPKNAPPLWVLIISRIGRTRVGMGGAPLAGPDQCLGSCWMWIIETLPLDYHLYRASDVSGNAMRPIEHSLIIAKTCDLV